MSNIDPSLIASVVSLIISLVALVRSRHAIQISKSQGDYTISPKLSLSKMDLYIYDDNKDMPEFSFGAILKNHSETAIKITKISLEYGHEKDERKRLKPRNTRNLLHTKRRIERIQHGRQQTNCKYSI